MYPLIKTILIPLLLIFLNSTVLLAQTSGYSGTGDNIDVTYYRCQWRINPDSASKGIKGSVTVYFVTTVAGVSQVSLDLNKTSFNNASLSVYYHGSPVSFSFPATGNVHILRISLPATLAAGVIDSLTVNYNGAPPAVAGQAEGYQKKSSAGYNYIYSLSESYEDKDWWPCKADMQDKPDSMDIYIDVPSTFTAVSLGRLVDSSINGANQVFHWKTNNPVATYLVAVGVAKYRVYDRGTVSINGTNVPVWYFLFPGKTAGTYTSILTALDHSMAELSAFSNVFGDYPFKDEKHGFYEFGWGGGMEHQSISAMGSGALTSWGTIAHELAHQWFGDKVTFSTWNHLWLAEGFARYAEALAAELVPALGQNPATVRNGFKTTANNTTYRNYACYIPNAYISSSDVLWSSAYGSTVYERGAMVVSMLRTLLGDTRFYQACRDFLNDPALAYRSATTEDLRTHMQNAADGYDLTAFFDSWVYGNGYPSYNAGIGWARSGTNRITIQVTAQSKSAGSTVSYYYTPIALRVQGSLAGQDTVIVVYDQNGQLSRAGNGIGAAVSGNIISFNLSFNPVTVSFDPFAQALATGTTSMNSLLDIRLGEPALRQGNGYNQVEISYSNNENTSPRLTLQKSCDGIHYAVSIPMQPGNLTESWLVFRGTDYQPCQPYTWYRIMAEAGTEIKYSRVLKVVAGAETRLKLSPNPADKSVLIQWENTDAGKEVQLLLLTPDGRVLARYPGLVNNVRLPTTHLPGGLYTVLAEQEGRILFRKKLMISHGEGN